MSKKVKKEFRLSFALIFRLSLFIFLVWLLINYLGSHQASLPQLPQATTSPVGQQLFSRLPLDSQKKLVSFYQYLTSSEFSRTLTQYQTNVRQFVDLQFRQIKINIVNRVAAEIVDRINQP